MVLYIAKSSIWTINIFRTGLICFNNHYISFMTEKIRDSKIYDQMTIKVALVGQLTPLSPILL